MAIVRQANTNKAGGGFSPQQIEAVWQKGTVISDFAPSMWRRDAYGIAIRRDLYGQTVEHGWEIDHILPVSKVATGDADHPENLQPLQWQMNRKKGDVVPPKGMTIVPRAFLG